jgi:hypothetical protein
MKVSHSKQCGLIALTYMRKQRQVIKLQPTIRTNSISVSKDFSLTEGPGLRVRSELFCVEWGNSTHLRMGERQ